MNKSTTWDKVEAYARYELKLLLDQCTEQQLLTFKRMYSHTDSSLEIYKIVDAMTWDKIKHAMYQCENSIKSNKAKAVLEEANK